MLIDVSFPLGTCKRILSYLREGQFFDRFTRRIEVQVAVHGVNTDTLSIIDVQFEQTSYGMVQLTRRSVTTAPLARYADWSKYVLLVFEVAIIVQAAMVFAHSVKAIWDVYDRRRRHRRLEGVEALVIASTGDDEDVAKHEFRQVGTAFFRCVMNGVILTAFAVWYAYVGVSYDTRYQKSYGLYDGATTSRGRPLLLKRDAPLEDFTSFHPPGSGRHALRASYDGMNRLNDLHMRVFQIRSLVMTYSCKSTSNHQKEKRKQSLTT